MRDIDKRPIVILSSIPDELSLIRAKIDNLKRLSITGKIAYRGRLSTHDVILMNTGIGKVNAAHSVTILMEHFPFNFAILCGVGGAYPDSGLETGDIAIASKEIYGDEGVFASLEGMREIGFPLFKKGRKGYFNEFPLDRRLIKKAMLSGQSLRHMNIHKGPFITLSSVSGSYKRAIELKRRFNAICENMEGAAIAHVCAIYKIPMLEIRGISNMAGIRDKRRWNLKKASENCQRVVMEFIKAL
jgi:futalosine hydrolase